MSRAIAVVWDDGMVRYDFGRGHPFAPVRLRLAMELVREFGLLEHAHVELVEPEPADLAAILSVHDADYVAAVRRCSDDDASPSDDETGGTAGPSHEHANGDHRDQTAFGLGTDDTPVFHDMHEATALLVGGTVEAARRVWSGDNDHAVNLGGGLHHAMPTHAAGFCVYNDLAVAIRWLLDNGAQRVAYVDVDVHHGDGVERAFWNDPRVMTISLHESGATQYPGTGWPVDTGGPDAQTTKVNCALPSGIGDDEWLRAFDAIVPPLLQEFAPDVLVSQHGCDNHAHDPLGHMRMTVDGQHALAERLHGLAHDVCDGRWVATGGGGYAVVDVVPRAWTHLVAEAVHRPIATAAAIPQRWRELAETLTGLSAPSTMGDGTAPAPTPWSKGHDPDDPVDAAIMATRRAVFPAHGLDPWA